MLIRHINPNKMELFVGMFNAYKLNARDRGWQRRAVTRCRAAGVRFPDTWNEAACENFMDSFVSSLKMKDNSSIMFDLVTTKNYSRERIIDILCRVFCNQPVVIPNDLYIVA